MTQVAPLIINSPYAEPSSYWSYDRETRAFSRKDGRRPAGYVKASEKSKSFDDPGIFIEIPLVNTIRSRAKFWREAGYPGVTGITKRLLEHWHNPEEREYRRFFFCRHRFDLFLAAGISYSYFRETSPGDFFCLNYFNDWRLV